MRKLIFNSLTILLIVSTFVMCRNTENGIKSVDIDNFMKIIEDPDIVLVDVRTEGEYLSGHIPGTDYNIDVTKDDFSIEVENKLKGHNDIAIYCRSGNRSKKAAEILKKSGYNVIELDSGYKGWIEWAKSHIINENKLK